jgi:hypothetical protein
MKYNQPYGVSDPNAAYINGNPSTGTMGSIPPAASIENPQREIVAAISAARMTPTDTDLAQLAKAIQSGQIIYADDAGTINNLAVTLSPNVGANFVRGFTIVCKAKYTNTGISVINVNGAGNWPITHTDGTQLASNDINAGGMLALVFDGANFQLVWTSRQAGTPVYLTAPRDYYVNGTTGNDAFDGTTATVGGGHGPFATLQKAADQIPLFNLNNWSINVHVADGTYDSVFIHVINGSGQVGFFGNTATPANVTINAVNKSAIYLIDIGGTITFDGFKVQTSGSLAGDGIVGIAAVGSTNCYLGAFEWGPCNGTQAYVQRGALIGNKAPNVQWRISGGSVGNVYVPGAFLCGNVGGNCIAHVLGGPIITITAPVSYAQGFILSYNNSFFQMIYASLTGAANVTARRYDAEYNSAISTAGGGPNYYPGTVAGTVGNGSYYT